MSFVETFSDVKIHYMSSVGRQSAVKPFKVQLTGKPLTLQQTAAKYRLSAAQVADVIKLLAKGDSRFEMSHSQRTLATLGKKAREPLTNAQRRNANESGKKYWAEGHDAKQARPKGVKGKAKAKSARSKKRSRRAK